MAVVCAIMPDSYCVRYVVSSLTALTTLSNAGMAASQAAFCFHEPFVIIVLYAVKRAHERFVSQMRAF